MNKKLFAKFAAILCAIMLIQACQQFVHVDYHYEITNTDSIASVEESLRGRGYELKNGNNSNPKLYAKYNDVVTLQTTSSDARLYISDASEEQSVLKAITGITNVVKTSQCQIVGDQTVTFSNDNSRLGGDKIRAYNDIRSFLKSKEFVDPFGVHANELYLGTIGSDCRLMSQISVIKSGNDIRVIYHIYSDNLNDVASYQKQRDELITFFKSKHRNFDSFIN